MPIGSYSATSQPSDQLRIAHCKKRLPLMLMQLINSQFQVNNKRTKRNKNLHPPAYMCVSGKVPPVMHSSPTVPPHLHAPCPDSKLLITFGLRFVVSRPRRSRLLQANLGRRFACVQQFLLSRVWSCTFANNLLPSVPFNQYALV